MTGRRKIAVCALVGLAAALALRVFSSAPDLERSGAETSTSGANEQSPRYDGQPSVGNASGQGITSERSDKETKVGLAEPLMTESSTAVSNSAVSFQRFMSMPEATAESYVMRDGAIDANRLEELASPDEFDRFAAYLERDADAEARATAEKYWRELFEAASRIGASVTVSSVSCGTSICAAKIQSGNSEELDEYLTSLRSDGQVAMYATMEMPPEAEGRNDIRRIVFTTDPTASAFEFAID